MSYIYGSLEPRPHVLIGPWDDQKGISRVTVDEKWLRELRTLLGEVDQDCVRGLPLLSVWLSLIPNLPS